MNVDKYFKEKVICYEEIRGHFNRNFKVQTVAGVFHLKLFHNQSHIIKKWINGTTIHTWTATTIKKVCQSLIALHTSNQVWRPMDYKVSQIQDFKYKRLLAQYKNNLLVPCHNDLNQDNIILTQTKAHLIDFEFKRLNNKHWDVANIINEDNLGLVEINLFLLHYPSLKKAVLEDFLYINKTFNHFWKKKHMLPKMANGT